MRTRSASRRGSSRSGRPSWSGSAPPPGDEPGATAHGWPSGSSRSCRRPGRRSRPTRTSSPSRTSTPSRSSPAWGRRSMRWRRRCARRCPRPRRRTDIRCWFPARHLSGWRGAKPKAWQRHVEVEATTPGRKRTDGNQHLISARLLSQSPDARASSETTRGSSWRLGMGTSDIASM